MAIDRPDSALTEKECARYKSLGLSAKPFRNVRYYIPYEKATYLSPDDIETYIYCRQLKRFKYCYEDDRESLEMLFEDIDDSPQTMESIISKLTDNDDDIFGEIKTWQGLLEKVHELSQKSAPSNEIHKTSWRKFDRIISKAIKNDPMFGQRPRFNAGECRLSDELRRIHANDVYVIDIVKLSDNKQAFVFGDALRTIYKLKLGEYDDENGINPPSRIIIFVDELNKYASKDAPKGSPVLREILDITERGRSLGVILFGAEQFRSSVHPRVTGNCAAHAYGRTNALESSAKDYSHFPSTYRNILSRLEQGEYLLQSPIFRTLLRIKFPRPVYKQFND